MQGAAAYKNGKTEPARDTAYKRGWLWARGAGILLADTAFEAAEMKGYEGARAIGLFLSGARDCAAGVKRAWDEDEAKSYPYREGWEWESSRRRSASES